jgi:hypothetical protein
MTLDLSRYRTKNIKDFLNITDPDTFIVFVDGSPVSYEYLTGSPRPDDLADYIENLLVQAQELVKNDQAAMKKECSDGRCRSSDQDPLARPSWRAAGYYGVMGGEPPLGYGRAVSGYSFSMGFRRLPN